MQTAGKVAGRRSSWLVLGGILLGMCLTLKRLHAGEGPPKKAEAPRRARSRLRQLRRHLARIVNDGDSSLYVSGYAYHSRSAYGRWTIEHLNENAWGGGFGKTLENTKGSVASLAGTAFKDSLGNWEYNLGYMREWRTAPFDGRLTLGAGLSAMLMSRPDFFGGTPFPAVLPQLTLGYGDATLIAVLVPPIPEDAHPANGIPGLNGDVIYAFLRIKLP